MRIPVIYYDNSSGLAGPDELEKLIQRRLIISFRRSTNWVRVGTEPVRGAGGEYRGPERRKSANHRLL